MDRVEITYYALDDLFNAGCSCKHTSFTSRLVATSGLPGFPTENLDDLAYVKEFAATVMQSCSLQKAQEEGSVLYAILLPPLISAAH
ncbi:hypothetical protein D5086_004770 [Populus alba]|uniref:Uncharacterized protein n=1 Tax=Populus alba TaxID=43335 RepID=A0ACC4CSN5_POPAL